MEKYCQQLGWAKPFGASVAALRLWEAAALLMLLLPAVAFGQAQTPVMAKASNSSAAVSATPAERAVDPRILPLFGERSKSPGQIADEIRFLNDCDQNFGSRAEASQFFAQRGWEYIADTQVDTAAYRFNLAHILDDKNPDVYWGLGVICYQRSQLTDAVRMLKRGVSLADTNAIMLVDLATVELEQYQTKSDTASLTDARDHLQKATFLRPEHAPAYSKLSIASYLQADYRSAWTYLHKAYNLDIATLDTTYLRQLLDKQPDPLGVFR